MRIQLLSAVAAVIMAASPSAISASEWSLAQTLKLPGYVPVFAATTPSGDVVVTTFNSQTGRGPQDMPVVLIHQPGGPKTQYFVVCQEKFDENRGFSGVAVDSEGNYYIAADTGNGATSWVRKYKPNGQLDPAFGNAGTISTGKRLLGLDITGNYLFTTAAFADLLIYNRQTGQPVGTVPKPANAPNIRDIAVNPSAQTIYGVAEGAAYVWEGGTFDNPAGYRLRQLSDSVGKPRAGEGIYFDAASQRALMPDSRSGSLLSVSGSDPVRGSRIAAASPDRNSLADAALLQDGTTLLVTDMINNAVYVMKRAAQVEAVSAGAAAGMPALTAVVAGTESMAIPALPVAPAAAAPRPAATTAPALTPSPAPAAAPAPAGPPAGSAVAWLTNYEEAKAASRQQQKPLLLYARAPQVNQCLAVENGLLKNPDFADVSKSFVCCYFDVSTDRQLAQQLGIFKVPSLAMYKSTGERSAMLSAGALGPAATAQLRTLGTTR